MRPSSSQRASTGFSLIELLIAVIIIGILVAIIIPVLLRRADDARVAGAESDLEHLQGAEERAHINTGHVYRFYALDDVAGGDGRFMPWDPSDVDGIRDEGDPMNPLWGYGDPTNLFLSYKTGDFYQTYTTIWQRLIRNETDFGWGGPYINYNNLRDVDRNDLPEDPWGEEYLLFTPRGWVDQWRGVVVDTYYFFATDLGTTIGLSGPYFDRFTVLSKGPNRAPGNGTSGALFGTDDDLKRQF